MARDAKYFHIVALESIHCPIPEIKLPDNLSSTTEAYIQSTPEDIPSRIAKADIVLITTCRLNESALSPDVSPNLKLILIMAAGTDCVNLPLCKSRGIRVVNCPGANVDAVSEHAIGLYFATRRSTTFLHNAIIGSNGNDGLWTSPGCLLSDMHDGFGRPPISAAEEVMGILGYGKIGKRNHQKCLNI